MKPKYFTFLFLLFVGLLFFERPQTHLFEPDEARYAEIPREMLAQGNFVIPTQNGSNYLEKPPLLYWLNAASFKILGETPYAARLPIRLATLGTALLLFFEASPLAALIYLSSFLGFALGRVNITDGLLTFGLTLAFFSLKKLLIQPNDRDRNISEILLGIGMAIATLSKGLIGFLFPGLLLMVFCVWFWNPRKFFAVILSKATLVFLLITVPWFVLAHFQNNEFSYFFFIHEHLKRFATDSAKREQPALFFIFVFLLGFLPWTGFFLSGCRRWVSLAKNYFKEDQETLFSLLWFVIIVGFFSLSKSKLVPYILPAFPAAAVLTAQQLSILKDHPSSALRVQFLSFALFWTVLFGASFFILPRIQFITEYQLQIPVSLIFFFLMGGSWISFLKIQNNFEKAIGAWALTWFLVYGVAAWELGPISKEYSSQGITEAAIATNPNQIVAYECYPESIPWVLKQAIPVVGFKGELNSVGPLNPDFFWNKENFWSQWDSGKRLAVVARHEQANLFLNHPEKPGRLIGENRRYSVLTNF